MSANNTNGSCKFHEIFFMQSPIGILQIITCSNGIHSLKFHYGEERKDIKKFSDHNKDINSQIGKSMHWLNCYFTVQPENAVLPPICPITSGKDSFTKKVWSTLIEEVPFGKSISYRDLAVLTGNPEAARAVGNAMRRNPVPLFIPCHRVIKHDGSLGKFTGGVKIKQWLTEHENSK